MEAKKHQPDDPDESTPIARQLRRLRDRPIETARLGQRVRAALGLPELPEKAARRTRFTPGGLAAIILFAASIVGILSWWVARPVMASPLELAQAHAENIAGEPGAIPVTSMAEAHRAMAGQWARCPYLAEPSCCEVVSCHVHILGGKRLLCVRLSVNGIPITLAAASAADLRLPDVPPVIRGATRYFVQTAGATSIVTTNRDGVWLTLIGDTSANRLIEIAGSMTCGT